MGFTTLDYIVLVVYLAGVALFGMLRGGKQQTARDYFLGRETIPWWVVCFSIVAAETSTLTFISIPGLAYLTNLGFLQVTIGYLLGRIAVGFLFLPSYYKGELVTAYGFLENRFGSKTRSLASVVFLFTRIAADGVRLFATAIPLKFVLGVEYPVAIAILAVVALLYTYAGGVRGVIWVDAVQMIIYIGGALLAAVLLVSSHPGGWTGSRSWHRMRGSSRCSRSGSTQISGADHTPSCGDFRRRVSFDGFARHRPAGRAEGVDDQVACGGAQGAHLERDHHHRAVHSFPHCRTSALWALQRCDGSKLGLKRADEIFPRYIIEGLPGYRDSLLQVLCRCALDACRVDEFDGVFNGAGSL